MNGLDLTIIAILITGFVLFGLALKRRTKFTLKDFYLADRRTHWVIAGLSMATVSMSVDTPLAISGIIAEHGIAGS